MSEQIVTVFSSKFSVPGTVVEQSLGTLKISYHPPGTSRQDWFHDLNSGGKRAGLRMGDNDDDATRYSVSPAMADEPPAAA